MKKAQSQGWHVLYVKSRHEKKVYEKLLENDLEAYLPLVLTERKWSDRVKKVLMPLFKSYVFVYVNTAMDFYRALSVNGVCSYISFGNDYAIVKDEEIEKLKFLIDVEGISEISIKEETLCMGEHRVISNGPLAGLECEVIQIKNKSTVRVRLGTLKQNVIATVPSEYLSEFSKAI